MTSRKTSWVKETMSRVRHSPCWVHILFGWWASICNREQELNSSSEAFLKVQGNSLSDRCLAPCEGCDHLLFLPLCLPTEAPVTKYAIFVWNGFEGNAVHLCGLLYATVGSVNSKRWPFSVCFYCSVQKPGPSAVAKWTNRSGGVRFTFPVLTSNMLFLATCIL